MAEWIKVVETRIGKNKMKRMKLIGETIWLARSNAARAMFGCFDGPDHDAYIDKIDAYQTNLMRKLSTEQNVC